MICYLHTFAMYLPHDYRSGFVQLLTTALFILEGGPKPAFYDGLIPVVNDGSTSKFVVEGGWRKVAADGVNYLNPDVFVAQNRFNVMEGKETAFEGTILFRTRLPYCLTRTLTLSQPFDPTLTLTLDATTNPARTLPYCYPNTDPTPIPPTH